jgi:hypothetical protein
MSENSEWFNLDLDIGDGWDTETPSVPLNPKNYQRLMRNEIHRVHRTVARALRDILNKREARLRKELGEQMLEMKTKMLEEARAEIRKAVDAGEAVVDIGDLRRHGRRAA